MKMVKCIFVLFAVILLLGGKVYANDDADKLLGDYSLLYGEMFDGSMEKLNMGDAFSGIFGDKTAKNVIDGLNKGDVALNGGEVVSSILKLLFRETTESLKLSVMIFLVALLASYLEGLKTGFGETGISEIAFYACYIVIAGICATVFRNVSLGAAETIENIAVFMKMVVPAVVALLFTSGAIISASALEPAVLVMISIIVPIIETVFIPLITVTAALNIANGVSERFKTDKLISFINGVVKWGLTILVTIFVSLAGLKSIAASGVDGLTLRLSRFATANLVPIIGGALSEAVGTVMSCSSVIKNSIGVLGIICIFVIVSGPMLKLGATILMLRLLAAVSEPISNKSIVTCISKIADSVGSLFSVLSVTSVMFVVVITILINAGSSAFMLGKQI